jgi:lysine biosynthesis protein LysW
MKVECPACHAKVHVGGKPRMGQKVKCRSCDAELEVVWLEPLELDWAYDEDEFEDEYDEDYEDAY